MKNMLYGTIAAFLTIIVAIETHRIILLITPPLYYTKVTILTPVVTEGPITVQYEFHKQRVCRVTLDRFVIDIKTNKLVHRESVIGSPQGPGEHTIVNDVAIPKLAPSEYELATRAYSECSEGMHAASHDRVTFTVK